jgi:hypothetical protein
MEDRLVLMNSVEKAAINHLVAGAAETVELRRER